ncbi:MAG: hypothetical protein HY081_07060 [Gammaproteobacteria bacterium]|nr:hypothetical protein [Gammaproteobacteria bacterium]
MGQLLRIIIILFGLWLVIQIVKRALASRNPTPSRPPIIKMLMCSRCGVHMPESQAIKDGDKIYCCEEHRRQK